MADTTDLSESDQLYINVGRCLTAWNAIEDHILHLIEYASYQGDFSSAEVAIGYWAVVSFEARLKWCSAVVSFRTREAAYAELSERWNALNNRLIKKARKRAEVAHGSVVTIREPKRGVSAAYLVPYYHRRRLEHMLTPRGIALSPNISLTQTQFADAVPTLSLDDLKVRIASFSKLRRDLAEFHRDWLLKDKETGYHG